MKSDWSSAIGHLTNLPSPPLVRLRSLRLLPGRPPIAHFRVVAGRVLAEWTAPLQGEPLAAPRAWLIQNDDFDDSSALLEIALDAASLSVALTVQGSDAVLDLLVSAAQDLALRRRG